MSNLCIIPARGGSRRIPRKNIKDFLGKPIIAYSIDMALKTELFDEVMVSTDDEEIAAIARQYGAKVPFYRTERSSNDFATTKSVLIEVVNEYSKLGLKFKNLCCIYPTAVLASVDDLIAGYKMLGTSDMVMPVTEFSFPPLRSLKINESGNAEFRFPEYKNTRSQDLEAWYQDAGQWYWYKMQELFNESFTQNLRVLKLPNLKVQDIDNSDDWYQAKFKYQILNKL
jgi:pseudaminic acid cytidylyltransferase